MRIPLAYLDAAALEEVDLDLWSSLFECIGFEVPVPMTYEGITQALQDSDPTPELRMALECAHQLGSEDGSQAIADAMADQRVPWDRIPGDCSPREQAVHLFIAQHCGDGVMQEVYTRALVQVSARGQTKRYYEFLGKEPGPPPADPGRRVNFEEEVRRYCMRQDLGDHVQAREVEDPGALIIQIIHSSRMRKHLAVMQGAVDRSRIAYRPVHADLLRYDALHGTLRIYVRRVKLVSVYRRLGGRLLFGHEDWFSQGRYSLVPLQRLGQAALDDHRQGRVLRVWATELEWEGHGESRHLVRSSDVFAHLERVQFDLTRGRILRVKLKLEVVRKSRRPLTLELQGTTTLNLTDTSEESLVDAYLRDVGLLETPEDPDTDLWDLVRGVHPFADWSKALGEITSLLMTTGALEPAARATVAEPDGWPMSVHELDASSFYGVDDHALNPARTLSPTDIEGFRLNRTELARLLAEHWTLEGQPSPGNGNLLSLGTLAVHCGADVAHLDLWYAAGPATDVERELLARQQDAVVLVPPGGAWSSGGPCVQLDSGIPDLHGMRLAVIEALGWDDRVDAPYIVDPDVRLVVDERHGQVWLDGTRVLGINSGSYAFRLLGMLAAKPGRALPTEQIQAILAPARQDETTATRQAKNAAVRSLREAASAAGTVLEPYDPLSGPVKGTYRCGIPAAVLE